MLPTSCFALDSLCSRHDKIRYRVIIWLFLSIVLVLEYRIMSLWLQLSNLFRIINLRYWMPNLWREPLTNSYVILNPSWRALISTTSFCTHWKYLHTYNHYRPKENGAIELTRLSVMMKMMIIKISLPTVATVVHGCISFIALFLVHGGLLSHAVMYSKCVICGATTWRIKWRVVVLRSR